LVQYIQYVFGIIEGTWVLVREKCAYFGS